MTRVEFIYDTDCPNVQRARKALLKGFTLAQRQPSWTEWDQKSSDSPGYVRRYGSPTILVDGRDVAGSAPGDVGPSCRLYNSGSGALGGAPSAEQVAEALCGDRGQAPVAKPSPSGWRSSLWNALPNSNNSVGSCPKCVRQKPPTEARNAR